MKILDKIAHKLGYVKRDPTSKTARMLMELAQMSRDSHGEIAEYVGAYGEIFRVQVLK